MASALVSATDLAAIVAALPATDRAAARDVTALAPDPAAPAATDLADLAVTIVVAMTAALPASKTHRSSALSSPARSSPMTRSSRSSAAR